MTFSARATLSAEQQCTGRHTVANELHADVQRWAMSSNYETHELYAKFLDLLKKSPLYTSEKFIGFRGRRFDSANKPSRLDMGPPPAQDARGQRYSKQNYPALYLSETKAGVLREPISGSDPLWIQKFVIPIATLRIADFRVENTSELATQVFWFAEHAGEASVMPPIEFSQFVASLVARQFDGMLVPGIRGDREYRYSNLVVLKRVDEWKMWLHESDPHLGISSAA